MQYQIHVDSSDEFAAHTIAARVAHDEGMHKTAERHEALARHIKNATQHASALCPTGYRVKITYNIEYTLDVNPVLLPELQYDHYNNMRKANTNANH